MRTNDAPLGQWAEWLARRVLGGTLERNSSKSHDLVTPKGRRVQVKARLVRDLKRREDRQLSVFRSFEFDECLVLLFDPEYSVRRAAVLPSALVQEHAKFRKHVNGAVLFATNEVLDLGGDLTDQFQSHPD
ncbi:MAG: hypothetical protein JST54_35690 [Deltaproteobacteria bacterium]|nr:hypothetical protein [Deltaproteobacteria bacterium]